MTKSLSAGLLIGILSILLAMPVLAAYYISISVTESNGTDYDVLAMNATMDVDYLADNGFITATGLDVRVKNSQDTELPFMLADDKLMLASPVAASKTTGLELTTGNTALSSFPVITGNGGYVTITDHANLELGSDFEIEFDSYIDTAQATDLVNKTGTFKVETDGSNHVTATIYSPDDIEQTVEDQGITLNGGGTIRAGERIDDFPHAYIVQISFMLAKQNSPTGTAYIRVRRVSDDGIVGTIGTIDVSTLTTTKTWKDFTGSIYNPVVQDLRITIEYDGGDGSNQLLVRKQASNPYADGVLTTYTSSWSDTSAHDCTFKVHFGADVAVVATVITGVPKIKITGDGTDFKIYKNDVEEDSATIIGVQDNANNWVLSNMPYLTYYKHTTSDTLRVTYQPDSIIQGTTLPNETNPGTHDGTITWGSNPAGIAITLSGLQVEEGYYYTGGGTGGGGDIFEPEPAQLISGVDLDKLSHNPFAPLVNGLAEASGGKLPASIIWIGGAWFILIGVGTLLIILVREHLVFAAAVSMGLAITFYVMGIFDYWVLIILGILLGASIVHEKAPQW